MVEQVSGYATAHSLPVGACVRTCVRDLRPPHPRALCTLLERYRRGLPQSVYAIRYTFQSLENAVSRYPRYWLFSKRASRSTVGWNVRFLVTLTLRVT
jgi:hypothetical protein